MVSLYYRSSDTYRSDQSPVDSLPLLSILIFPWKKLVSYRTFETLDPFRVKMAGMRTLRLCEGCGGYGLALGSPLRRERKEELVILLVARV